MAQYHYMTHPDSDGLMFVHPGLSWECKEPECKEVWSLSE